MLSPLLLFVCRVVRADHYLTTTVISAFFESAPSLAVAIRRYVPGSVEVAFVVACPFVTAIGPALSNFTFAGPRYSSQLTTRPRGRPPAADELTWAPKFVWPGVAGAAGRGAAGTRGLGNPSSITAAVST